MMAFMRVLAMALALASSTAWTSHPYESARNQYEVREDRPQLPQPLTEDRPKVHFIKKTEQKSALPDLQVGCGDGHIHETQSPSETDKNKVTARGRIRNRRKRSYSPWSGQVVYSVPQSISVWNPPVYQLSRPYYIPIYGVAGRPPIFFPPQPLHINTGAPPDNPIKPFQGPPYLPPPKPTTEPTTTMEIGYRYDDRPVWDIGGNDVTQRPVSTTTAIIPTRRTRPPGTPKTQSPPLIHNPTGGQPSKTQNVDDDNSRPPPPPQPQFTTRRPNRPVLAPTSRPNAPSQCVWAIISCCSVTGEISYDCFEQRGCPGAFWDNNPCDNDFAKAAISAALNYYESK